MSERNEWLTGLNVGDKVWLWRHTSFSGRKAWEQGEVLATGKRFVEVRAPSATLKVRRNCRWGNGCSLKDSPWYMVQDQPVFERHLVAEWEKRDKLAPRLRALLGSLEHMPWNRLVQLEQALDALGKEGDQ